MATSLAPVSIANISLSRLGAQPINSISDQRNAAAIAVNTNWELAYLAVSRDARWNCLMTPMNLVQSPQTPLPGITDASTIIGSAVPWAQNTFYSANSYVTFGGSYYLVMYDYTSSNNFTNDLTTGALQQTDQETASTNFAGLTPSAYPSGWSYQYLLPSDFQYACYVNGTNCWAYLGFGGNDFQLQGNMLYCNWGQAVLIYVKNQPDSSQFDALFTDALAWKLAAMISTQVKQDGGDMEQKCEAGYQRALRNARMRNGVEGQVRRWSPIRDSNWIAARTWNPYGGA